MVRGGFEHPACKVPTHAPSTASAFPRRRERPRAPGAPPGLWPAEQTSIPACERLLSAITRLRGRVSQDTCDRQPDVTDDAGLRPCPFQRAPELFYDGAVNDP